MVCARAQCVKRGCLLGKYGNCWVIGWCATAGEEVGVKPGIDEGMWAVAECGGGAE